MYGHTGVVRAFHEHGVSLQEKDDDGKSLMQIAVESHSPKVITQLHQYGMDVNEKNASGESLLHIAARKTNNTATIQSLLDAGASIDAANLSSGNTALILAIHYDNADTVKLLLERGADTNIKNKHGNTAFDFMSEKAKSNGIADMMEAAWKRQTAQSFAKAATKGTTSPRRIVRKSKLAPN